MGCSHHLACVPLPRPSRLHLVTLLAVLIWWSPLTGGTTASDVIFGPKRYLRTTAAPNRFVDRFSRPGSARAPFLVHVVNGDGKGAYRVSAATVTLNGVEIFAPKDF